MRMINRLIDPSAGRVLVEGRSTMDWDAIQLRRRIGYVIQEAGLFPHFTVRENVALVPELLGWSPERVQTRVEAMLELVGLGAKGLDARSPSALSGGQRQRVGIARALAADPPILLLDEPFSALDPITRRDIQREFKDLQSRLGKTMVFVTHDVREALMLASRIALLKDGKLEFIGTPTAFLTSSNGEARAFAACLEEPALEGRHS
jgi:osmoprotectant transport system ATP-binding protein